MRGNSGKRYFHTTIPILFVFFLWLISSQSCLMRIMISLFCASLSLQITRFPPNHCESSTFNCDNWLDSYLCALKRQKHPFFSFIYAGNVSQSANEITRFFSPVKFRLFCKITCGNVGSHGRSDKSYPARLAARRLYFPITASVVVCTLSRITSTSTSNEN